MIIIIIIILIKSSWSLWLSLWL